MKKSRINERDEYIRERVAVVNNKRTEIRRIARELFLSERTVYNALNNACKDCKHKGR